LNVIPELVAHGPEETRGAAEDDVLRLQGLTKSYGAECVLDDVSLSVAEGEFVTLLGPSGSGKTTTLMSVAGFVEIDDGDILIDGRNVSGLPPHRRDIGMVFQNYALFPHLTVLKNVTFPLRMRGIKGAEGRRRATEILEVVGLAGFASRTPRQLSGGQQQRVALARAMVFEPRLLLLVEPLGALDKNLRTLLQSEIMRISRELGATTLYVTHDQDEAMTMSDRIAVYSDGRIRQCGTPEEIYTRPASVFVAEFLGESNILRGAPESSGRFRTAAGPTIAVPRGGATVMDAEASAVTAVLVRPEVVRVKPVRDGNGEANDDGHTTVTGTVREVAYLGADHRRVIATTLGPIVSRAAADGNMPTLAVGDEVSVSWPTSACAVLRDE
jgi:putative spermidine/putrescine transport system ATP-binding protein